LSPRTTTVGSLHEAKTSRVNCKEATGDKVRRVMIHHRRLQILTLPTEQTVCGGGLLASPRRPTSQPQFVHRLVALPIPRLPLQCMNNDFLHDDAVLLYCIPSTGTTTYIGGHHYIVGDRSVSAPFFLLWHTTNHHNGAPCVGFATTTTTECFVRSKMTLLHKSKSATRPTTPRTTFRHRPRHCPCQSI
jgi:hypothetical protein